MNYSLSVYTTLLTMEPLDLSPNQIIPVFVIGTFTYCAILFFNFTLLLTIALNRQLYKPMYILLFNLPISDIIGATAFFPQMMLSILSENRTISYSACYVQAFLAHFYGTASGLILTAMAYDRYIAICCPLKYNALMSPETLWKIVFSIWALDFALVGFILGQNNRKEICATQVVDMYCNNPTLMKLICEDVQFNNYSGLFLTVVLQIMILVILIYTYIQILITCLSKRQSDAKSKAIQTCGTHLMSFFCFEFSTLFALIAHRFAKAFPYLRRMFGVTIMIFPPFLNPLIYGLKTKEIRQRMIVFRKISLKSV